MSGKRYEFNERSLRILQLANQAALSTRSKEICTEHLLLGLVRVGNCTATLVLSSLGVKLPLLKSSILTLLPSGPAPDVWRKLPFSMLAVRVFDVAEEEAASLGKGSIGTAHLLLALLKVNDGVACKVLTDCGMNDSSVRAKITMLMKDTSRRRVPRSVSHPTKRSSAETGPESPKANPDLIEKTKQQIRKLVIEINKLASQDIDPQKFYDGFLSRVVSSLAAMGRAVWMLTDAGALRLEYQFNLPECLRDVIQESDSERFRGHAKLLHKTLADGHGAVVEPRWVEGDDQVCNPSDALLILGVVEVDRQPRGIVEIFQRPGAPPTTQRGYLKFVSQMCEIASRYLQRQQ